jgi:hypothetical protein
MRAEMRVAPLHMRAIAVPLVVLLTLSACAGARAPEILTLKIPIEGAVDIGALRERAGAVLGRHNARAFLRETIVEGQQVSLVFEGEVSEEVKSELAMAVGGGDRDRGSSPPPEPPPQTLVPATLPAAPASPTTAPPVDDAVSFAAARRIMPSVVHLRTGSMPNGTGFVVSADGLVLTNSHVARGMGPDSVAHLYDGRRVAARVVGLVESGEPDIAVVQIEVGGVAPVEFADAAGLRPGEPLLLIGHPQGYGFWRVTGGKLLDLEKVERFVSPVQTVTYQQMRADLPGAPGSSGSPFVDLSGRVVGILFGGGPQPGEPREPRPEALERIIWDWDEFLARAPRAAAGVASEDARRIMREILAANGNVP